MHRIASVEVVRHPELRVTFDDDLTGTVDLSDVIETQPAFSRLRDEAYFRTVAVGDHGRAFGWSLDAAGREIDVCADATRIQIETQIVEEWAARFRAARSAAE